MKTASLLLGFAVLLLATVAGAGTKAQMTIVPSPADCFTGPGFCMNVVSGCATLDNSDCVLGTMSPKSTFKINGKRHLKAKIKGVTDNTGALMTTGPAETATDNLVLKVTVSACPVDTGSPPICDDPTGIYLKVVLTGGKGRLNLDLSTVAALGPVGNPFALLGVSLWGAPANPGDCAGTNSPADVATRVNDSTCETSNVVRGVGGLIAE